MKDQKEKLSMKTNKKSPPRKVVENIRREMTNPNFPYKNINLMPDATPLEKNKYEQGFCTL